MESVSAGESGVIRGLALAPLETIPTQKLPHDLSHFQLDFSLTLTLSLLARREGGGGGGVVFGAERATLAETTSSIIRVPGALSSLSSY